MMNRWTNYTNALWGVLLLCGLSLKAEGTPDYSDYERLLKTYVEDDGVDYAAWVCLLYTSDAADE